MKTLSIVIASLLLSLSVIAQDKHQCAGKTKAGVQCQHKTTGQYCKVHDPASIRCGAPTKSGQPCKMVVKVAGSKCYHHAGK